jgi:EmrB/QacA subfamily drug resistance transporter
MSIAVNARVADHTVSHPWLLAIPMILGLLTLGINVTSMNIALPRIMVSLGAELRQIQWVQTAFMITQAIMMPTVGWLGARFGNKNLYVASIVSFIVGSVLCGMAWDVHSLIFFRILQATGGGTLMPVTMTILYEHFPREKRGLAMGLFNFAYGLGPAIGPPLNGYLIQEMSWRAVFYLNIPVGLISLTTAALFLPKDREQRRKVPIDYHGFIAMALFLITLLTALAQGQHEGWDSTYIISLFTMASMFFLTFVLVELRAKTPLVELRTYNNFAFSMASIVALLSAVGFRGANFLVDVFLQTIMDFLPFQAGVLMVPGAIVLAITGLAAGRLSDNINPKILMVFGAVVSFVALYGFSFITVLTTGTFIVILLVGRMLGGACIMSPLAIVAFKSLPEERIRLASGLLTLNRSIGASLAIAIAVTLLENRREVYAMHFYHSMDRVSPGTQNFIFTVQQSLQNLGDAGNQVRAKSLLLLRSMVLEEAAARAYQDVFFLVGILFLIAIIPIMLCGKKRRSGTEAGHKA